MPAERFLTLSVLPRSPDLGLLVLRVAVGGSLFLKHGWEKVAHFSQMSAHFPDPIHIGAVPSLVVALISDAVCSLLLVLGLATRWAALIIGVNIAVAWALVHHLEFFGHQADHGEVCFLYLVASAGLFFSGPGRFSLDRRLGG